MRRLFTPSASTVRNVLIIGLIFVLGVTIGFKFGQEKKLPLAFANPQPKGEVVNTEQPSEQAEVDFQQFWEVWQVLERDYYDPSKIDSEKMVQGAIGGMTSALGDPYTVYLPPEQDQRAAEELAGAFYGVGIELGYIDETLAVIAPLKGMPAQKAGVEAGDLILHVKDEAKGIDADTTDWSISEAVSKIRGERGTSVTLTLYRKDSGREPFEVVLQRDEIVIPSVEVKYVEHAGKKVAHLSLSRFGDRTETEWEAAVTDILKQTPAVGGVVLDMRNNPGGYFDGAIDVASEFVGNGVVVSQQGKYTTRDFKAKGKPRLDKLPLVVLVNKGSASASEIVAGALRDLREAKLVGQNTFGKGTVQDRRHLEEGGGLHVTVARWLLPKGESIQEKGIPVAVEVTDDPATEPDEAVLKAIESL